MSKKIMETNDCLYFYQLLLPICDTSKSCIEDDPWSSYYNNTEEWSNIYAVKIGLGGTYGNLFENLNARDLVVHDGCIVGDGVCGSSGTI